MKDVTSNLASLGLKTDTTVTEAVAQVRTFLQGDLEPAGILARSYTLAEDFGVADAKAVLGDNPNRARLFATSLVASAIAVPTKFDVEDAIKTAVEKVANIEKMGLVSKSTKPKTPKAPKPAAEPKAPKKAKESKPKVTKGQVDITKALDIFKADPTCRVYDLVTRVAEAYDVDRAKAYSILHRARKAA